MIISPSILSVDENKYYDESSNLQNLGIKMLHIDVMDGKFVPNTTDGIKMISSVNSLKMILDVHLMLENPSKVIEEYAKLKADIITIHSEINEDIEQVIDQIHSHGMKCGISIKPNTSVSSIAPYLHLVDLVLVMSVEPGYGGQKFIDSSLYKVKELAYIRNANKALKYVIEVDGGINSSNAPLLRKNGADIVVIGTFLMNSDKKSEIIKEIETL